MKVLVCSDIHANYEALKVLKPYLNQVDLSICLGDIIGYSCAVNECIDFLRTYNINCIQGNHDRYLIEGLDVQKKYLNESVRFGINIAKHCITEDNLKWLTHLPISLGYKIGSKQILFVHGSPFDPTNEYVYANTFDVNKYNSLTYSIVAMGHTHRVFEYKLGGKLYFNPGSIGQARDNEGLVCFSILDINTLQVNNFKIPYDFRANLDLSISYGGKDWIYKHFQTVLNK